MYTHVLVVLQAVADPLLNVLPSYQLEIWIVCGFSMII